MFPRHGAPWVDVNYRKVSTFARGLLTLDLQWRWRLYRPRFATVNATQTVRNA